jgi:uncharacterized RDD family membrane protein YckC
VTTPDPHVPKEARPFQGRRAGLVTRVLASAVDGVVVLALLVGGYAAWAAVAFLWNPSGFRLPAPSRLFVLGMGYLVCVAYLAVCWRVSGRTYGGQVMGLRVVGRGGRPLGLVAAVARAVVCVVFPLGLLWTAVSRGNLSVADLLLRTRVIYDWRTAPPLNAAARP